MKCPVDGTTLTMADRAGVEIDYCPQCRGVWLDRGELDKILDRAGRETAPEPTRRDDRPDGDRRQAAFGGARGSRERYDDDRRTPQKKRESWWSDIFDF